MKFGTNTLFALLAVSLVFGCAKELEGVDNQSTQEKESGWVGADSFEVNALVAGAVVAPKTDEWADVAFDATQQQRLVDLQVKFLKVAAEERGWRLNQLTEKITIQSINETSRGLEIEYIAVVDMLGRLRGDVPKLSELDNSDFEAKVPATPEGFDYDTMTACAKADDGHSIKAYNFHYYFNPELAGCELDVVRAELVVTEVFDRPTTYPEYDLLMQDLPEGIGFKAALVPNRGDRDPMSRFDAHAEMLEQDLGLRGVPSDDGTFKRYTWKKGRSSWSSTSLTPQRQAGVEQVSRRAFATN